MNFYHSSILLPLAVWHKNIEIVYYLLARMQHKTSFQKDVSQDTHSALAFCILRASKKSKCILSILCQADLDIGYHRQNIIKLAMDKYEPFMPILLENASAHFLKDLAFLGYSLEHQSLFLSAMSNERVNKEAPKCVLLLSCAEGLLPELWKFIVQLLFLLSFRSCVPDPKLRVKTTVEFYTKKNGVSLGTKLSD